MKANELRVNNLVKRNDLDGIYEIRGVCKDRIHPIELTEISTLPNGTVTGYACQVELSQLKPIPLTPDMLEKAGFSIQPMRQSIWQKGRLKLWMGNNGSVAYLRAEDSDAAYYINSCKSLHQLQNLYFALTGTELNIKL